MMRFNDKQKGMLIINKKTTIPIPPPPTEEKPTKIESLKIDDCDVKNELMTYHTFTVEDDGNYFISHQLCLKCKQTTTLHNLQFGISLDDYSNQTDVFISFILNSECEENHILSNNLTSLVYLEKDKKYILWCNVDTSTDDTFVVVGEFSKLKIIKIK